MSVCIRTKHGAVVPTKTRAITEFVICRWSRVKSRSWVADVFCTSFLRMCVYHVLGDMLWVCEERSDDSVGRQCRDYLILDHLQHPQCASHHTTLSLSLSLSLSHHLSSCLSKTTDKCMLFVDLCYLSHMHELAMANSYPIRQPIFWSS